MNSDKGFISSRPSFLGVVFYDTKGNRNFVECKNKNLKKEVENLIIDRTPYINYGPSS